VIVVVFVDEIVSPVHMEISIATSSMSWRHLQSQNIEFTMKRLREPVDHVADRGWKRRFDNPIPLPRGRHIVTLEDAAKYIQKLPKAEQELAEWQAAVAGTAPGRRK
jgi:hypothetical protein